MFSFEKKKSESSNNSNKDFLELCLLEPSECGTPNTIVEKSRRSSAVKREIIKIQGLLPGANVIKLFCP
jgi:hypothetical protein